MSPCRLSGPNPPWRVKAPPNQRHKTLMFRSGRRHKIGTPFPRKASGPDRNPTLPPDAIGTSSSRPSPMHPWRSCEIWLNEYRLIVRWPYVPTLKASAGRRTSFDGEHCSPANTHPCSQSPEEAQTFIRRSKDRSDRRCRVRWQDFPPVSDEDQVPLNMMTCRASEGVVLEAKKSSAIVSVYPHQRHISVAPYTKHRVHSFTSTQFWRRLARGPHYNHEHH
jgi:hypothetical protein